jgi:hypothetical protein
MLGKILFLVFNIFAIGSCFACDEKCMSAERCYECVSDNISACVPVNDNMYGTLDNYKSWNCTLKTEELSIENLIYDICKIDNFVDDLCNITVGNDDNGFCLIASYINDICESMDNIKTEKYSFQKSFTIENVGTYNDIYPACTGYICQKEGWQFQKTDFGKNWCGIGQCKSINRKYYCTVPTKCGKYNNEQFQILGCGKEKFNCFLKKSCRQLLRNLDDCDREQECIFNLISKNSYNDAFYKLVKCMV